MLHVSPDGREIGQLVERLASGRVLLGICGAPGVGKTTLAAALAAAYGVPVVPMDGYHLPEAELVRRGRLDDKGAPDTFDAAAYAALLTRVRTGAEAVWAPAFCHDRPDPVPDAIEVPADALLVVTEGNYLLLDDPPWLAVRRQLHVVWHLVTDETARFERLVRRHHDSGKPIGRARAYVEGVDQPNARLVEAVASRADVILDLTAWAGRLDGSCA